MWINASAFIKIIVTYGEWVLTHIVVGLCSLFLKSPIIVNMASNRFIVYVTLTPKTPELLEDVRKLMESTRSMFLDLPGSISHDVGVVDGKVHVIETYASSEDAEKFEKIPEHDEMIANLLPLVTPDIGVVKIHTVGGDRHNRNID
ncbi:hypothetical protein RhiJN_07107 [Ceratobasidium sp. AG-Ba]|nr:hypothetical protein RhiJN_07107 [Ceratobasidium sp. AG-Ba]QRW07984.1 hypothetical protein RhiLY_06983 [Ceratobasidium sp. AG-Ba]